MPLYPPFLKKGDTVLLIAPARKVTKEEMEPALVALESWGLKVGEGPNLYKSFHQFAGTDEQRAADLQWAFDHSSAKAVLFAWGGYGTMRIIDHMNFTRFEQQPKWMAGFSDLTAALNHVYNMGVCSLHAPMPINFLKNREATASLQKLLFGETMEYSVAPDRRNKMGVAEGELVGGNLSMLYAACGSASEIVTAGKVLFIEDLDEYLYHVDRMMLHLKRAGKLKNLAALVVGGMSDMRDNAVPFGSTAEGIIAEAVADYSYPLCFGFPAGHVERNLAFYHGRKVRIEVQESGSKINYL